MKILDFGEAPVSLFWFACVLLLSLPFLPVLVTLPSYRLTANLKRGLRLHWRDRQVSSKAVSKPVRGGLKSSHAFFLCLPWHTCDFVDQMATCSMTLHCHCHCIIYRASQQQAQTSSQDKAV